MGGSQEIRAVVQVPCEASCCLVRIKAHPQSYPCVGEASKPLPKPTGECSDGQRERRKERKKCKWINFLAGTPDDPEIHCWRDLGDKGVFGYPEGCTPCLSAWSTPEVARGQRRYHVKLPAISV